MAIIDPSIQTYVIDFSSANNFLFLYSVEGDGYSTRYVDITLMDRGGLYYLNTNDTQITISGKNSSGTSILNYCDVIDENTIRVELTQPMLSAPGQSEYEIQIKSKSTGSITKSFPFFVVATDASVDSAQVISSNEFTALTDRINQADALRNQVQNLLNSTNINLEEIHNAINKAETAASSVNEAISKISSKAAEADEAVRKADTAVSHVTDAIASAENAAQSANEARQQAENAVTTSNEAVERANTAVSNIESVITEARNATSEVNTAISNTESVITDARSAISEVEQAISDATVAANGANDAAAYSQQISENASSAVEYMQAVIDEVQSAANSAYEAVGEVDTAISDIRKSISDNETLKQQVNTAISDMQDILDESNCVYVNIKNYGVVGDGITDDRASFQSALDSIVNDGRYQVFIPNGTYLLSNYITIPENVTLFGESKNVILKRISSSYSSNLIEIINPNITLMNITIDGNGNGTGSEENICTVYASNTNNFVMKNCSVINGVNKCFYADRLKNSIIDNCDFYNAYGTVGLELSDETDDESEDFNGGFNIVQNCRSYNNPVCGFEINQSHNTIKNCYAHNNGIGISVRENANYSIISENYAINNTVNGLDISENTTGVISANNVIIENEVQDI